MRAKEEDAEKEDDGKEEAEENTREVEEEEGYWAAASPAPPLSLPCCIQKVPRALLRCIDSFLQQHRARRRALPQETKQRCTGRFLHRATEGTAEHAAARCVA